MIGLLPVDSPAVIVLMRDSARQTARITPRIKGTVEGKELDCPRWDLTVKAINQFDNPNLYFYLKEGVFIYGIRYPGNAASSELRREDIILSINEEPVKTLDDVRSIWRKSRDDIDGTTRLTFKVLRGGLMNQIILDYARDYERE
jgi:S1-C subfamily serine protease